MVIAGAGGHALELIDVLENIYQPRYNVFTFYDQRPFQGLLMGKYPITNDFDVVRRCFIEDPRFTLAVGRPSARKNLFDRLEELGGELIGLKSHSATISTYSYSLQADILDNCWIGSHVQLGKGVLVNVGAQIHHEAKVGDFSVINPGVILLGACQVGQHSFIGAHATVLPGVKIGDRVTVGAGAVVIRDVPHGVTVVGVPGRVVNGN